MFNNCTTRLSFALLSVTDHSLTFRRLFFILTFASGKYQIKDKPTKTSEKTLNRRGRANMIDPMSGRMYRGRVGCVTDDASVR